MSQCVTCCLCLFRRLISGPCPREFYVCFQDSAEQNVIELAFKLGFGLTVWWLLLWILSKTVNCTFHFSAKILDNLYCMHLVLFCKVIQSWIMLLYAEIYAKSCKTFVRDHLELVTGARDFAGGSDLIFLFLTSSKRVQRCQKTLYVVNTCFRIHIFNDDGQASGNIFAFPQS